MPRIRPLRTLGLALFSAVAVHGVPQQADYEAPPISYSRTAPSDSIAELEKRLGEDTARLTFQPSHGYLQSILAELEIPISSQTLVFSKTSFQRQWINPRSPRALYFNDDVYIGWVKGAEVLEVASQDPQLGTVFYTLAQEDTRPARFVRQTDNCLQCHDSMSLTLGVPGVTLRSVYPGRDGVPRFNLGGFRTTFRSPLEERWGGWYVSGQHGDARHLGNITFPEDPQTDLGPLRDKGANLADLAKICDVEPYLAETSDIVALMVLEYQTTVHNLITRANHEVRLALLQSREMNRAMGVPLDPPTEGCQRRIGYACEPLLEALLFSGEAPLRDAVRGNSTFTRDFERRGPFDHQGRSLRQFDLARRMFKYPLSYLVYSRSYAGLPREAKDYLADRLGVILRASSPPKGYTHLSKEDRSALVEIVNETLPEIASRWK